MPFLHEMAAPIWIWLGNVVFLAGLACAIFFSPWRRLRDQETLNVFLGTCVALMVIWSIKTDVDPGLEFHMLCVSTVTLMFGWPLAVVAVSVAHAGTMLNTGGVWTTYGLSVTLNGMVPVFVTAAFCLLAERRLPRHFFVYVFVCAFVAGGVSMAAVRLLSVALVLTGGQHHAALGATETLGYLPLMVFPEALLNGMLITLLVAYRSHWVATFDDGRYLHGR